jgi:hypothetical protein
VAPPEAEAMTLDQFLAHLATHERGRGWFLDTMRRLRRHEDTMPISPVSAVLRATGAGLPFDDVLDIMDAADARPRHDRALRARLLAALGLEETRA